MSESETVAPELHQMVSGWDEVDQEPDVTIVVRATRKIGEDQIPYSHWEYGWMVEGEWHGALSQTQRDYAGALMRHMANLVQDPPGHGLSVALALDENINRITRRIQAELRATKALEANLIEYLVRTRGWTGAAKVLRMKEHKLQFLMRSRHKRVTPHSLPTDRKEPQTSAVFVGRTQPNDHCD